MELFWPSQVSAKTLCLFSAAKVLKDFQNYKQNVNFFSYAVKNILKNIQ